MKTNTTTTHVSDDGNAELCQHDSDMNKVLSIRENADATWKSLGVPRPWLRKLRDFLNEALGDGPSGTENELKAAAAEINVNDLVEAAKFMLEYPMAKLSHQRLWTAIQHVQPTDPCPDGLLPDGPTCPRCGGERGPSGVDGGSWVHLREHAELARSFHTVGQVAELAAAARALAVVTAPPSNRAQREAQDRVAMAVAAVRA